MGKESMSKYGTFFIQLENYNSSPGAQVNGTVSLDLRLNFPASNIMIKLEGKEKTKFWKSRQVYSHTDKDGVTHYRTEWYPVYGRHRIMNYEFPVAAFNGGFIPAGQYQIPFTFQMPSNVPSTFHKTWYDYSDCYAKIHYELKANLKSLHGKDLLKFKQPFTVNNSLHAPVQSKAVMVDKEVVCFCCCSKGKVKLNSYFEKNAYQPGETCYMVAEVTNDTSVKVEQLQAVFYQSIHLQADGWWGSHSKSWTSALSSRNGSSYEPNTAKVGANAERIQVELKGLDIRGGEDAGQVGGFNTTTHGKIIQCSYYVSAKCMMDTCICCDEHPNATIGVEIYSDPKPTQPTFVAPPNWAPQMYDMYTANLTSQFEAPPNQYPDEYQGK